MFGRFCGQGSLMLDDGNRYEGEFYNGQFHGKGTLYFPEGKLEGTWEHGKVQLLPQVHLGSNPCRLICPTANRRTVRIFGWS